MASKEESLNAREQMIAVPLGLQEVKRVCLVLLSMSHKVCLILLLISHKAIAAISCKSGIVTRSELGWGESG